MMNDARLAAINESLALAKQAYSQLVALVPADHFLDPPVLKQEQKQQAAMLCYQLLRHIERVADLTTRYTLAGAPTELPAASLQFYQQKIRLHEDEIRSLMLALLDLGDIEVDVTGIRSGPQTPIWNIIYSGLDFWEMKLADKELDAYEEEDLRAAEAVVNAPFFAPDDWYRNATEIEPVFGEKAERRIPLNVRGRLRELYFSFILNNHMAAIALARSILEYALVDRASVIGIDPREPGDPSRIKPLGWLVDEAAVQRPELKIPMETIHEFGNQILHPKKGDTVLLAPNALRSQALQCTSASRTVVTALYL